MSDPVHSTKPHIQSGKDSTLRVACLQFSPVWQQPSENILHIESLLEGITDIDLIVLPEMFNTGFALNDLHSDEEASVAKEWMRRIAREKQAVLCGSIKVSDGGNVFNRFVAISSEQELACYDKVHLFGDERNALAAGISRVTFELNGFRILPQICYDLRFPVFSRNLNDYDLAIYVASWPKPRIHHWDALLKARAIENLSYVIGVNRVGEDGNGWQYVGHSLIITPMGDIAESAGESGDKVIVHQLSLSEVIKTRQQLPYLDDRDAFELDRNG